MRAVRRVLREVEAIQRGCPGELEVRAELELGPRGWAVRAIRVGRQFIECAACGELVDLDGATRVERAFEEEAFRQRHRHKRKG
jgi:hypothetical protein